MQDSVGLIIFLVLLAAGFIFGRAAEQNHYKKIHMRENKYRNLLVLTIALILLPVAALAVDTDGDSYDDAVDAFPNDPGGAVDSDEDGRPDEIIGGFVIDDFETGDFSKNPWAGGGYFITLPGINDNFAASGFSGGPGCISYTLELEHYFSTDSTLVFWYMQEGIDWGCNSAFRVDGETNITITPGIGWTMAKVLVSKGMRTLRWEGSTCPQPCGTLIIDNISKTSLIEDLDDDNDGMPDSYENLYSSLDPLDNDASADNDNDGYSNLQEFFNNTNPEFTDRKIKSDTNADRDSDIIWRNRNTGVMTLWEIENKNKVSGFSIGGLGAFYDLQDTFDTDNDGDSDLILFDEGEGKAIAWEMENNVKVSGSFLAGFPGYTIRGLGDLDADGDGDIVWQEVTTGKVIVWMMQDGVKQSGQFLGSLGAGSVVEAIGDFDNDGDADLLWSIPSATALVRWDMENGTKASGAAIGGFVGYSIAKAGDFNKDNTDDILWQPDGGGSSIIWLMQNGNKQTGLSLGQVTGYSIATVGDYDGDGDDDILWSNTAGHTKIWELENGVLVQGSNFGTMNGDSDIRP